MTVQWTNDYIVLLTFGIIENEYLNANEYLLEVKFI